MVRTVPSARRWMKSCPAASSQPPSPSIGAIERQCQARYRRARAPGSRRLPPGRGTRARQGCPAAAVRRGGRPTEPPRRARSAPPCRARQCRRRFDAPGRSPRRWPLRAPHAVPLSCVQTQIGSWVSSAGGLRRRGWGQGFLLVGRKAARRQVPAHCTVQTPCAASRWSGWGPPLSGKGALAVAPGVFDHVKPRRAPRSATRLVAEPHTEKSRSTATAPEHLVPLSPWPGRLTEPGEATHPRRRRGRSRPGKTCLGYVRTCSPARRGGGGLR